MDEVTITKVFKEMDINSNGVIEEAEFYQLFK